MIRNNQYKQISITLVVVGFTAFWFCQPSLAASTTEYLYDNITNEMTATLVYDSSNVLAYTSTEYDTLGQRTKEYQGFGSTNAITTSYDYDVAGNLVTQAVLTDGSGLFTTLYQYDLLSRQTKVLGPSTGSPTPETNYTYDLNGNVVTQKVKVYGSTDAETITEYDELNRATKVYDPEEHYRTTDYDSQSRVIKQYAYDSGGSVTLEQIRTVYDNAGRVLSKIRMLNASVQGGAEVTTDNVVVYDYDNDGRVIEQTTFNMGSDAGLVTESEYDGFGRLTKHTDPKDYYESMEYDDAGRVVTRIQNDGADHTYTMEYNELGQMTKSTEVGTPYLETEYSYDALGRRITRIDATDAETKMTTAYMYDRLGRQTKVIEEDPEGGSNHRTTDYIYSKQGLLVTLKTNDGVNNQETVYDYSPIGKVGSITYPDGDGIDFTYYPNGAVSTRTDQESGEIAYFYDKRGLLLTKSGSSGDYWVTYIYDGLGRMVTARKGTSGDPDNDSETIYCYDDLSRVTEEYQTVNGETKKLQYGYDQAGNRTSIWYPRTPQ